MKYREWMLKQSKEFIKFVCGDNTPGNKYIDYKLPAITLKQLEILDERFINGEAEPNQQTPSGQE